MFVRKELGDWHFASADLRMTEAHTVLEKRDQIAALAEKSGGFEKDMRILARRIDVPVPPELQEER